MFQLSHIPSSYWVKLTSIEAAAKLSNIAMCISALKFEQIIIITYKENKKIRNGSCEGVVKKLA